MKKPRRRKQHLPPFFDRVDNPEYPEFPKGIAVDLTPPPPQLSPFDRDVLQVCGNLGDRVLIEDFQALLADYPAVFRQIKLAVGGEIFASRNTDRRR
jgi:hypothetical protein